MFSPAKSLFFASLMSGAGCLAVMAAAPPDAFTQGAAEYGKGHFTVARDCFRKVIRAQPRSQAAHYYLANTLAKLRDYAGALKEYEAGYNVNPDSDIAASCLEAMTNLKDYSSESSPPAAQTKATAPGVKPPDEDSVIDATRMIRTQLEKESTSNSAMADQYAKLRQEKAQAEAKRIQDEMQRKLNDMPIYRRGYNSAQSQQAIKDEATKQTQAEMARAKAESDYYAKAAKDRQATLSDVQASLESQLKNPGKTQLVPQGTNMYIRNYAHDSPPTTPAKPSP